MFAWRKPKPQDDEPLVPHGLIWQATEDPMPAKAERIDPGLVQGTNSPISVPLMRVPPPQDQCKAADDSAPKMGAASDPLPWASMNVKDAVKRPPPFWDRAAGLKTPSAVPTPNAGDWKSASSAAVKPELAALPAGDAGSNRSATREIVFKQFLAEREQELRAARSEFTHAVAELCANARHAYAGWEIQKNLRQTRERAQACLAKAVAQKPAVAAIPENNGPSKIQARLAVARNTAVRIQGKSVASIANSFNSVRRLRHRQVRIRFASGSQLSSYVTRFQHAQRKSLSMLQQNSRLATSLAMAALSALLALGLILVIGHYQPSASAEAPAAISTPSQGTTTVPANTDTAKPSPVSGVHRAATKRSPVVNTSLRTPANSSAAKTVRRPHHNEDEDYVAPDTYVYYGNKR